jgi:hypothetical protein
LQDVGTAVVDHFYELPESKYEEMFLGGIAELKLLHDKLEHKKEMCVKQRDKFKEMYYKMKQSSDQMFKTRNKI